MQPQADSIPLDESVGVTLNAAGAGTVRIGPSLLQRWVVTNAAVHVDSNTNEPLFRLFRGTPAAPNQLGSTYSGSNDSTDLSVELNPGNLLVGQWTGGDAGARATLSIYGRQYRRGQ